MFKRIAEEENEQAMMKMACTERVGRRGGIGKTAGWN